MKKLFLSLLVLLTSTLMLPGTIMAQDEFFIIEPLYETAIDPFFEENPDITDDTTITEDPTTNPNYIDPSYVPEEPIDPYYPPEDDPYTPEDPYYPEDYPTDTGTSDNPPEENPRNTNDEPPSYNGTGLFIPPPERETPPEEENPTENPPERTQPECPENEKHIQICPSSKDSIDRVLPIISSNQIKIFIMISLGALAGALLWILINLALNAGNNNRQVLQLERSQRLNNSNNKSKILLNNYNKISDSLSTISENIQNKTTPTKTDVSTYKKATNNIALNASEKTLKAHNKILTMLEQSSEISSKEFTKATKEFYSSIKKDMTS